MCHVWLRRIRRRRRIRYLVLPGVWDRASEHRAYLRGLRGAGTHPRAPKLHEAQTVQKVPLSRNAPAEQLDDSQRNMGLPAGTGPLQRQQAHPDDFKAGAQSAAQVLRLPALPHRGAVPQCKRAVHQPVRKEESDRSVSQNRRGGAHRALCELPLLSRVHSQKDWAPRHGGVHQPHSVPAPPREVHAVSRQCFYPMPYTRWKPWSSRSRATRDLLQMARRCFK